jgi:hypothetical protein
MKFLFQLERNGAGGAIVGADMPNLRGIVSHGLGAFGGSATISITILSSLVIVILAGKMMFSLRNSICYPFILATAISILVSYHTLNYDLSLLLPVVLLLFAASGPRVLHQSNVAALSLVLVYLAMFCEPFWPHMNQYCWPILILSWFYWTTRDDSGLRSDESDV